MKIYHFAIIFAVFAVTIVIIKDVSFKNTDFEKREEQKLDRAVENAVTAATWELRAYGAGLQKETETKAIDTFYYSLYAELGLMDDAFKRDEIKNRFPILMIFVDSGYYIYKSDLNMEKSGYERYYAKSELLPYDEKMQERDSGFMAIMRVSDAGGLWTESSGKGRVFTSFVSDGNKYFVDIDGIYHEEGCEYMGEVSYYLFSKEGCASLGAHPCTRCINN